MVDNDLSNEGFLCESEDCCGEPRMMSGPLLSSVNQCFKAATINKTCLHFQFLGFGKNESGNDVRHWRQLLSNDGSLDTSWR